MTATRMVSTRKQEGWLGVILTALVCGLFLWWWFQPEPVSAVTERDPLYWVGRARDALGPQPPSLTQRLEIIMISEGLRAQGEEEPAEKLEADWLPPSWRQTAEDPLTPDPLTPDAVALEPLLRQLSPVPDEFGAIGPLLGEAATAFDALEIEAGQRSLQEATGVAGTLVEPLRSQSLWLVAARQARNGLESDARATRAVLGSELSVIPNWLSAELMRGDIIAPVVAAWQRLPADDPEVLGFIGRWRTLVRDRIQHRDHPLFTRHGPFTDAAAAMVDPAAPSLWKHVESNNLTAAAAVAKENPSAHLAIARLLVWLAAPPFAERASP